jgi:hypothetical protein
VAYRADIDLAVAHAEARDQVVTRRGLLADGLGLGALDSLLASGVLTRALDGVYLLGSRSLSQRQLLRCVIEYAGPRAGLFGYSAGEQRGIAPSSYGRAIVSTGRRIVRAPRIAVPMRDGLPAHVTVLRTTNPEFVEYDGLPVPRIGRTLMEIATSRGRDAAKNAWRQADYRKQLDVDDIRAELLATRRRGAPILRELLTTLPDPIGEDIDIRSPPEIDFLALVARAGLPMPEVNVAMVVGGAPYVADFFWRLLGLVVEVDDPSHRQPVAQGRDRIRDVEFFIGELDVLRFETHRLRRDPDRCMEQLEAAIDRQRRRTLGRAASHRETV